MSVVSEDGSPHGPKTFVLWNPPLLQPNRRSRSGSGAALDGGGVGGVRGNPLQGVPLMSRTEARARKQFTKCEITKTPTLTPETAITPGRCNHPWALQSPIANTRRVLSSGV